MKGLNHFELDITWLLLNFPKDGHASTFRNASNICLAGLGLGLEMFEMHLFLFVTGL